MQPVQLSLMPDPAPAPSGTAPPVPAVPAGALPTEAVAAATALLAGVIAKAAARPGRRRPLMSELKVTAAHLRRAAVVYVRQSTLAQVDRNRESTARQYDLVARAERLGWPRSAVRVIDDDLGVSGASTTGRSGFAELAAQVGLGQVGIVLSLECSRLARNNADWYRLLDLAGMTDTLIADADGVYHPGLFNDRLLLGMKGTMSEAELHILRARLDGGIRNKAARGELRRGLPVGLVWGEADGEIRWHPDEAVTGVIATIFDRFAVCGSVRGVWLWLREQGLRFPLQPAGYLRGEEITWVEPTYHAVHNVLTHPAYAGAYVFGKTRQRRHLGEDGVLRTSRRKLPQGEWEVLIPDHHRGFIDWDTYQANQARIGANTRPRAHQPGTGAVREGCALLQGLATCGTLRAQARRLLRRPGASPPPATTAPAPASSSTAAAPGTCASAASRSTPPWPPRSWPRCSPPRCRPAWPPRSNSRTATTPRSHSGADRSSRPATTPAPPSAATGPSTRTTGWSPAAWKPSGTPRCTQLADAENELARRETARPKTLTPHEKQAILALGDDLAGVWSAATTTDKDRKTAAAHPARRGRHRRAPRPRPAPRGPRCCAGRAARSPNCPCRSSAHRRSGCAPTRTPSTCCAGWPPTTPTPPSPGSSTGKAGAPPGDCRSPPVGSSHCATTGTSPATSPATDPQRGRTAHRGRRRPRTRTRPVHPAPLAERRVHRR